MAFALIRLPLVCRTTKLNGRQVNYWVQTIAKRHYPERPFDLQPVDPLPVGRMTARRPLRQREWDRYDANCLAIRMYVRQSIMAAQERLRADQ